jgi:hypothetical protein
MLKWMKEIGIECFSLTMLMSTMLAIAIMVASFDAGVPIQKIEKLTTQWSIPWFVLWYIFCRTARSIKIKVVSEEEYGAIKQSKKKT